MPADKAAFYKATQPIRDKYGAKYAVLLKRSKRRSKSVTGHARRADRAPFCVRSDPHERQAALPQAMEWLYIACIVRLGAGAGRDHADHPVRRVHALRR